MASWLPSAGWILTYDAPLPEVGQSSALAKLNELQRRALDLVVRNLAKGADRRVSGVAVSLLYQPALYSNPEVIAAAQRVDTGSFARLLPGPFDRELRQAAAEDKTEPQLVLTADRLRNFTYFRDFVIRS